MKYFLTGACGFIGSNIALTLVEQGHEVLILDKLTYAANMTGLDHLRIAHLRQDLAALTQSAKQVVREFSPDYVIHLAAESMVDRSLENNRVFFDTNVIGTWQLLELIKTLPIKKAVFFSTDETYGSLPPENFNESDPSFGFKESQKLDPHNPYAGSKAAADQVTISYVHNFKLPVCIVRPTNNYGQRQHREKLLPLAITNLLQGKKIPVYGRGLNAREWLHVADTCSAVATLIEKGLPGEVYNVGSGSRCTNMHVLGLLCQILNLKLEDNISYVADRLGHDWAYAADSTKIRGLGWTPKIDLETGLRQTVEWYKANKDW